MTQGVDRFRKTAKVADWLIHTFVFQGIITVVGFNTSNSKSSIRYFQDELQASIFVEWLLHQ